MAIWALSSRKWMSVFRVTGAGNRNAISASLNRSPGLSAGEIQVNAILIRASAEAATQMKTTTSVSYTHLDVYKRQS